jgi:YD repeat-containing protein
MTRCVPAVLAIVAVTIMAAPARAQTTTYHLHNEGSATLGLLQLKTSGPDAATVAIQWNDMKNQPAQDAFIRTFDTQPGVPGLGGVVPNGSTVTFTLRMRKTASFGTVFPRADLRASGSGAPIFCAANGTTALTTTLQPFTFSCTTTAAISMSATDRLTFSAGFHMTAGPANHSMRVELDYEGISPSTDSYLVAPNPIPARIDGVNPASGPVSWPVTITGANFGATQGSSTVTFNGTTATPSSWSNTSITTSVPAGATTGPVVVNVGGTNNTCSGSCAFTVIPAPSLTSITSPSAHRGDSVTIVGTNFLATRGTSTVTFNGTTASPTSWSDTSIVAPVPAAAITGPVVVTVSQQPSNGLAFTVILPGTLAGTITKAADSTPLTGATAQAVFQGVIKGSATTPAAGTYSIANLDPGTYDLRVLANGYSSEVRSVTVTAGTTTTEDVAMLQPGSINGLVTQGGTTPLPGAAVTMFLNGLQKGSTQTDGSGNYVISGLHPGSYTLQVADVGYRTKEQGALITDATNTIANVSLDAAPAGPVSYAYDALGRLVSVVDPSGDAATYTYDPVGNILSISRIGAGTVAITQISPGNGAVGAAVTVYGTGFSPTPAQNTVTFNGTQAVIASSTNRDCHVRSVRRHVRPNRCHVAWRVGNQCREFQRERRFCGADDLRFHARYRCGRDDGDPLRNEFRSDGGERPRGAQRDVRRRLDGVGHQPGLGRTCRRDLGPDLRVDGKRHRHERGRSDRRAAGVHGSRYRVHVADRFRGRRRADGARQHGRKDCADPVRRRGGPSFLGQVVECRVLGGAVTVLSPYGELVSSGFTSSGLFLDPQVLAASGTYSVVIDPSSTFTGSLTLTVYDVPPDVTGAIVPDGPTVSADMNTPGQNARYTFAASLNQRISLSIGAGPAGTVSIMSAGGVLQGQSVTTGTNPVFLDTITIPEAGTYTVLANPSGANVGSLALTLHNAPDLNTSITPGGNSVNVATAVPGQRVIATFTATANQRVSLNVTNVAFLPSRLGCKGAVSLVDANNATLRSNTCMDTASDAFLDVTAPLAAGAYRVIFDPAVDYTGSATLTLYDVPADVTGPIAPGGSVIVTTTRPGQNVALTFTATDQERVSLNLTSGSMGGISTCNAVKILEPDGSPLVTNNCIGSSGGFIDTQTLSPAGVYTIVLDPGGTATGSMTLSLYDVVDVSGALTLNAAFTSVAFSTPGQNASYTFSGASGQLVTVRTEQDAPVKCVRFKLIRQTGQVQLLSQFGCGTPFNLPQQTLPATDTYIVVVDPQNADVPSVRVRVSNP